MLRISDTKNLDKEKAHILNVLVNNGYNRHQGLKAFLKASRGPEINKDSKDRISSVHIPFIQGTTDKIDRILKRHNVPSSFRPLNTIRNSLRSAKDLVDPKDMKGVYVIPCSCGTCYVREIGHSINQRIQEHPIDIKHGRTWFSALAKHVEKNKHHICLEEARVIAKIVHFHH